MGDVIIKEMIIDAPGQVIKLDSSIDNIDDQISEFEAKRDSIKGSVCDKVATSLESYLNSKFIPSSNYYIKKGENYNQSLDTSGSIIDWKIYEIINIDATCSSETEFITIDNTTSNFIRTYSTVKSSTYDPEENQTTVVINDSVLNPSTFSEIWKFKYSFLPGDDLTIDEYKSQWDFGHDYLILPMGTSGTYGILDNIEKLKLAKNLLLSNKTKINDSITILEPFK